jgi:hypothetical protein
VIPFVTTGLLTSHTHTLSEAPRTQSTSQHGTSWAMAIFLTHTCMRYMLAAALPSVTTAMLY